MRESFENSLNNNLVKMFNTQRDYINQEINRLGSVEQKSIAYRRNGIGNFGARQMVNFYDGSDFAIIGASMGSTTVA